MQYEDIPPVYGPRLEYYPTYPKMVKDLHANRRSTIIIEVRNCDEINKKNYQLHI